MARRRQRAIDLAVLQAETAQLQVEALRAELAGAAPGARPPRRRADQRAHARGRGHRPAPAADRAGPRRPPAPDPGDRAPHDVHRVAAARARHRRAPARHRRRARRRHRAVHRGRARPTASRSATVIGGSIDPSRLNVDPDDVAPHPEVFDVVSGRAIDLTDGAPRRPADRAGDPRGATAALRGAPAVRRPLDRRLPDRGDRARRRPRRSSGSGAGSTAGSCPSCSTSPRSASSPSPSSTALTSDRRLALAAPSRSARRQLARERRTVRQLAARSGERTSHQDAPRPAMSGRSR